jgi:diacylglycerol kinase (ATP)
MWQEKCQPPRLWYNCPPHPSVQKLWIRDVYKWPLSVEKCVKPVDNPYRGWVMIVCNPVSGTGRGRERMAALEQVLRRANIPHRSAITKGRGDATRLARSAALGGCGAVVAIGGDGTLFEVANGVLGEAGELPGTFAAPLPVAVGLIVAGRGSDFARSVGIPADVTAACRRILNGRTQVVDVGHASYQAWSGERRGRYFLNAAGLGFDAEVSLRANNAPRVMGGGTILSSLLTTLVRYRNRRMSVRLDGGKEGWKGRANSIVIANGQYFGGGMRIAPDANLTDGKFEIVTLGDLGKIDLVRNVPRVYDGSHLSHPKVSVSRAQMVEVASPERPLLQADGEVLGRAPATLTVVARALRIIV